MSTALVVDDDAMFRMTMRSHLQSLGYDVIEAEDGTKVLQLVQQHQPVVCLVDLVMDNKEGIETIRELVELPDRPVIFAVSANAHYLGSALEFGANSALIKPISREYLQRALENHVEANATKA